MELTVREKAYLQDVLSKQLSVLENNHKQAKKPDRAGYTYRVLLLQRLLDKIKVEPAVVDGVVDQESWAGKRN